MIAQRRVYHKRKSICENNRGVEKGERFLRCSRGMAPATTQPTTRPGAPTTRRECNFVPYSRNTLLLSYLQVHTKMTTTLIPIPDDAYERSNLLFSLKKAITLPCGEFERNWPLVNTVYTKIGGLLPQQNGTVEVQKYECRLRKSKKQGRDPPPQNPNGIKKDTAEQHAILDNAMCESKQRVPSPQTQPSRLLQSNG